MTTNEHDQVCDFFKKMVQDTMRSGFPGEGFSLRKWLREAVFEKIVKDLPSTYPQGDPGSENFIFSGDRQAPVYLPQHKSAVTWLVTNSKTYAYNREMGDPSEADLRSLDHMKKRFPNAHSYFVVHVPYDSNRVTDVHTTTVYSDADESSLRSATSVVRDMTHGTITKQSKRDKQQSLGPSDLSNPCDLCVGRKIAEFYEIPGFNTRSSFSLKAWVGTSVHEKLERDLPRIHPVGDSKKPNYYQEVTTEIANVSGLGVIKGHIDLLWNPDVVDYKTADLYRIDKYKEQGPPKSHIGQTALYLLGVQRGGHVGDRATLVYIPRDSDDIEDIYVTTRPYQEQVATGLLSRAQNLVEMVRSGQTTGLASDSDCFVCHVQPLLKQ